MSVYDWEKCDHKGIGMVGCPTCDPDKGRVMIRKQRRLDNRDLRDALAAADVVRAAVYFVKHLNDYDDHIEPEVLSRICRAVEKYLKAKRGGK